VTTARADLWTTVYEVDFTSLSTLNIKTGGAGAKVIDGQTWTWGNDATAAACTVGGGNGVKTTASATVAGYYEAGVPRTLSNLTIPVQSLFPNFNIGQTAVRVLCRVLYTNAALNADGHKLAIEDKTVPIGQHAWLAKWFVGAGMKHRFASGCDPTSSGAAALYEQVYPDNATASTDDVQCLVFTPGKQFEAYSGVYTAGESPLMRITNGRGSVEQNTAIPLMRLEAQPRIMIGQVTSSALSTLITEVTHLRLDYYSRKAAA
jgi:hypothetical protein